MATERNEERTKCQRYFDDNVCENQEELLTVGDMALKELRNKLRINLVYTENPISVYAIIFDAIREVLKEYESKKDSYAINIANRVVIGFSSSFDDPNTDVEKKGNFVMYIQHVNNETLTEIDETERKSVHRCAQWNAANLTTSLEACKKIAEKACKFLDDRVSMPVSSPECIIPMFCLIHQCITRYVVIRRSEENSFEYRMNVAGCYDIFAQELEDGVKISFKPSIYDKGELKHDGRATSKYE